MPIEQLIKTLLQGRGSINKERTGAAFAPVNIALCKYWGKRDNELNLPVTSSLSIALPEKGAYTQVSFTTIEDDFCLNDEKIAANTAFAKRLSSFLDWFRPKQTGFKVNSYMNIPAAAGLASSACGFAALVLALDRLFAWQLDKPQLSILARLGSGSACRSLWNGFVEWHAGEQTNGMDSFAAPLPIEWPELRVGLLICNTQEKSISSRLAMQQTVATSSNYKLWPAQVATDINNIKQAIKGKDFWQFGKIAEANALAMHATMLTAWPPILYWQPETVDLMHRIWQLRAQGMPIFFTQDAGPNLKLLFLAANLQDVQTAFPDLDIIVPFTVDTKNNDVVLVDEKDRGIGIQDKLKAHQQGLRHRAFSVFIFRRNNAGALEVLLQQRQHDKYHCGGLWSNTCCSHPRQGEPVILAAKRRLSEEMGIGLDLDLVPKGIFEYRAEFANGLVEHEVDHVFVGFTEQDVFNVDTNEVAAYQWLAVDTLLHELQANPTKYTPWLAQALAIALKQNA